MTNDTTTSTPATSIGRALRAHADRFAHAESFKATSHKLADAIDAADGPRAVTILRERVARHLSIRLDSLDVWAHNVNTHADDLAADPELSADVHPADRDQRARVEALAAEARAHRDATEQQHRDRFREHVAPVLAATPLNEDARNDAERVAEALAAEARTRPHGSLERDTLRRAARMLEDATASTIGDAWAATRSALHMIGERLDGRDGGPFTPCEWATRHAIVRDYAERDALELQPSGRAEQDATQRATDANPVTLDNGGDAYAGLTYAEADDLDQAQEDARTREGLDRDAAAELAADPELSAEIGHA